MGKSAIKFEIFRSTGRADAEIEEMAKRGDIEGVRESLRISIYLESYNEETYTLKNDKVVVRRTPTDYDVMPRMTYDDLSINLESFTEDSRSVADDFLVTYDALNDELERETNEDKKKELKKKIDENLLIGSSSVVVKERFDLTDIINDTNLRWRFLNAVNSLKKRDDKDIGSIKIGKYDVTQVAKDNDAGEFPKISGDILVHFLYYQDALTLPSESVSSYFEKSIRTNKDWRKQINFLVLYIMKNVDFQKDPRNHISKLMLADFRSKSGFGDNVGTSSLKSSEPTPSINFAKKDDGKEENEGSDNILAGVGEKDFLHFFKQAGHLLKEGTLLEEINGMAYNGFDAVHLRKLIIGKFSVNDVLFMVGTIIQRGTNITKIINKTMREQSAARFQNLSNKLSTERGDNLKKDSITPSRLVAAFPEVSSRVLVEIMTEGFTDDLPGYLKHLHAGAIIPRGNEKLYNLWRDWAREFSKRLVSKVPKKPSEVDYQLLIWQGDLIDEESRVMAMAVLEERAKRRKPK